MKRFLIPRTAFFMGSILIASFYIGILAWAQGWEYLYKATATENELTVVRVGM